VFDQSSNDLEKSSKIKQRFLVHSPVVGIYATFLCTKVL
jgi:hypothetical protein